MPGLLRLRGVQTERPAGLRFGPAGHCKELIPPLQAPH